MNKSLPILLACFAVSTSVFAVDGIIPKCTNGTVSLVLVNKDVPGCPGAGLGTDPSYCLGNPSFDQNSSRSDICLDTMAELFSNTNDSMSIPRKVSMVSMSYVVGYYKNGKYGEEPTNFNFIYDHGAIKNNCSEAFGTDVTCTLVKSGDENHKIYTLTLSYNH